MATWWRYWQVLDSTHGACRIYKKTCVGTTMNFPTFLSFLIFLVHFLLCWLQHLRSMILPEMSLFSTLFYHSYQVHLMMCLMATWKNRARERDYYVTFRWKSVKPVAVFASVVIADIKHCVCVCCVYVYMCCKTLLWLKSPCAHPTCHRAVFSISTHKCGGAWQSISVDLSSQCGLYKYASLPFMLQSLTCHT